MGLFATALDGLDEAEQARLTGSLMRIRHNLDGSDNEDQAAHG